MVKMVNFMLYFTTIKSFENGVRVQVDSLGTNRSVKGSRMAGMEEVISEYSPIYTRK